MANQIVNKIPPVKSFSYPETPKQCVIDCVTELKKCLEEVPIDSVQYLILRRVIKDIDFTAAKIC